MDQNSMVGVIPKWAKAPFQLVIDHLRESSDYAESVALGITSIEKVALAEKLFQELDDHVNDAQSESNPEAQARLNSVREQAAKANQQIQEGLPLLHAQLSLGIWSVLEAAMEDFAVAWLCNIPGAINADELAKIRIPASKFEELDKDSRMRFVLEEYKRNLGGNFRRGVDRFEILLKPFGLDGSVEELIKKNIYELSQVRNALLHNGGRMDHKLKDACPWIDTPVGEKIKLNQEDGARYTRAVTDYLKTVIDRIESCNEFGAADAI